MSSNPPTPTPTPPQSDPAEETRFRAWFDKYVKENESTNQGAPQSVHQNQGGQSQGGQTSLESAIEAILTRRASRDAGEKRLKDLESSNQSLATQVAELTKLVKKGKSTVFSIFDGL